MNVKLRATDTSLITITRDSSVELSRALRKMLEKLGDDFIIADIEYASEFEGEEKYSVTIIGAFGSGKVLDLDEEETQDIDDIEIPDDPPVNPDQPNPDNPNPDNPNPDNPNPDNPNPDQPNPDNPNPDQPQDNKDEEQDAQLAELQASFDAYREETQSKLDSLMLQLQAIQALLQQQQQQPQGD